MLRLNVHERCIVYDHNKLHVAIFTNSNINFGCFCMIANPDLKTVLESASNQDWRYLVLLLYLICLCLSKIDKTTNTSFFGWIVSAFSIGQLISSPLFGFWSSKSSNHKLPIIVCLLVGVLGNVVYFYLESVHALDFVSPKWWMLFSRFIMGVGAGMSS